MAAGATWKLLIASAPWAARAGHTSVIDAAGAIYVIGGVGSGSTYFNDVWGSTDGGGTELGGVGIGFVKGYSGVSRGY